jgi:hypothetical protein
VRNLAMISMISQPMGAIANAFDIGAPAEMKIHLDSPSSSNLQVTGMQQRAGCREGVCR